MKRKNIRVLSFLICVLLTCAFPMADVLAQTQTYDNKKSWNQGIRYGAQFSVADETEEGYVWQNEEQTVRVMDECLMVDLLWLAQKLGLSVKKNEFQEGLPPNSMWRKIGEAGEKEFEKSLVTFEIRKEKDSLLRVMLCTGVSEAIVFSPYTGILQVPMGSRILEEKDSDGSFCYWVPLDDILFLVDSYGVNQNGIIEIYPCRTTVQDILNQKEMFAGLYCDVFEESGVSRMMLGTGAGYRKFYHQLQELFQGAVNFDMMSMWESIIGPYDEGAGERLALQFCSASDREYEAVSDMSREGLAAYSTGSPLIQELCKTFKAGYEAQGNQLKSDAEQLYEVLLEGKHTKETDLLFELYNNGMISSAELLQTAKWFEKAGNILEAGLPAAELTMGAWLKYSMLISELNTINLQYSDNVSVFLKYYSGDHDERIPEVLKGMESKVEFYRQEVPLDLKSKTVQEEIAKFFVGDVLPKVGEKGLGAAASKALLPYQLASEGWTLGEIFADQESGGAFDGLDCLELSLYGMQLETGAYRTLLECRNALRYEGDMTSPDFDQEKLKDFTALAWSYLKACYVTRENMLGIYQTRKHKQEYEIAAEQIIEMQEETARLLEVLNSHIDGVTPERIIMHDEVRDTENRYLLKSVKEAFNNGGEYVRKGESIYYWKYNKDSFDKTAFYADFPRMTGENNQLVRRLDDNTETVVYQGSGYGNIFIYGGRFYLTGSSLRATSWSEPCEPFIYSIDMEGKDRKDFGPGRILDMDEENGFLVCMSAEPEEKLYLINCEDGERTQLCESAVYMGGEGGYVYYENCNEKGSLVIEKAEVHSGQKETIVSLPGYALDNGLQEWTFVLVSQILEGYLYFNYGFIDNGTGSIYGGGLIGRIGLDGSGYEVIAGPEISKGEALYVYADERGGLFVVTKDTLNKGLGVEISLENKTVKELGTERAGLGEILCENGTAYFYPNADNNSVQILTDPRLSRYPESQDYFYHVCNAEIAGEYLYYVTECSIHKSDGDIGWRGSYERQETILYRRLLEGGEPEELYRY